MGFFFLSVPEQAVRNKDGVFFVFFVVTVAFDSIRRGEASHRCSSAPQQSNNPWEDLFSGIMVLAVMLPGTSVTIIPTKSNVWGCVCVCVCVCVLLFITGYYLLLLWVLWLSFNIQPHVLLCERLSAQTGHAEKREETKPKTESGKFCLNKQEVLKVQHKAGSMFVPNYFLMRR